MHKQVEEPCSNFDFACMAREPVQRRLAELGFDSEYRAQFEKAKGRQELSELLSAFLFDLI